MKIFTLLRVGLFLGMLFQCLIWFSTTAVGMAANTSSPDLGKTMRDHVPVEWRVESEANVYRLVSPNEMSLHPSPDTGLPNGDIRGHCKIMIEVGKKVDLDERERIFKKRQAGDLYKGEEEVWLPDFFDATNGYRVQAPGYCPVRDEDRRLVNECYKAVTHDWTPYPSSHYADPKAFLDGLRGR